MTLKVYLSGRYERRTVIANLAEDLTALGYKLTSRWLDNPREQQPDGAFPAVQQAIAATSDLQDIDAADVFVYFADERSLRNNTGWYTGGRHVELGYAFAKGKQVVIVGSPENVFHHLRPVVVVPDWPAAVVHLGARLVRYHQDLPMAAEPARAGAR